MEIFSKIIDFSSCRNLKIFKGELLNFIQLGNLSLEKAEIYSYEDIHQYQWKL